MKDQSPDSTAVITAAEIARLAGVTRAAVSNWRRRYQDFPAPVSGIGTTRGSLFALSDVESWLEKQRKGQEVSTEVKLWQALRGVYGEDVVRGLAAVAAQLAPEGDKSDPGPGSELSAALRENIDALAAERTPQKLISDLVARYITSAGRGGGGAVSTSRLVRAVRYFAGDVTDAGAVYDPVCGIGSLLLTVGGSRVGSRIGQEIDPTMARLTELRARIAGGARTRVVVGDSLRNDLVPDLRADLVVAEPPVGMAEWGREELLLDPRWELGVPSRAEGELAWLQHCYFHTAPGGRAVLVMPASVGYRKAGRRIRADLVRRGALTDVVALPAGMADAHSLPLHLWVLRRPASAADAVSTVRMTDLTDNDPDGSLEPDVAQVCAVPLIDLLDEAVDLTPGRYVAASRPDYPAEYGVVRAELERRLRRLAQLLPDLLPGLADDPGGDAFTGGTVSVGHLARAGLVDLTGGTPRSASDQLDTDYLRGFIQSAADIRRSTTASGTHRTDPRSARLPQMGIERQRSYGAAFRSLGEFDRALRELAELGDEVSRLARGGLAGGALVPPPDPADDEPENEPDDEPEDGEGGLDAVGTGSG